MSLEQKAFEIKQYEIEIETVTGLYIGAGKTGMRIGGVDNEFIRNPNTNEPYIPGSSLKGKVRSLLEYYAGLLSVSTNGNILSADCIEKAKNQPLCDTNDMENILKLFGTSAGNNKNNEMEKYGITRLSFSDLILMKDCDSANKPDDREENFNKNNYDFTEVFEVKPETTINRYTGKAENPRFTERVVAGTKFKGSITLKIFHNQKDNEEEFITLLKKGLILLELDALGGSSSRGYGKVSIIFNGEKLPELSDIDKK